MLTEPQFWARVNRRGPGECWPWTGPTNYLGYGQASYGGQRSPAHRIAYRLMVGEIPAGYFVCHSCDNPPCCNPAHLWTGTPRDNTADMVRKGRCRPPRGETNGNAKLTVDQVRAIFGDPRNLLAIAADYGVSAVTIHYIRTGKRWAHVTASLAEERIAA